MLIRLSVIIPTLNEADNLRSLVPVLSEALAKAGYAHEVIIVDDGSRDGTLDVVRNLERQLPVELLERQKRLGLSSAVLAGLHQATGESLVVMDADHSHPAHMVSELVRHVASGKADLAIGSRYVAGGSISGEWPWWRHLSSRLASLAARPITRVHDPMAGFFALRRDAFLAVESQLRPTGFKILLELLATGQFDRVVEVPIRFADRKAGRSKLGTRVVFAYAAQLLRLYTRRSRSLARHCLGGLLILRPAENQGSGQKTTGTCSRVDSPDHVEQRASDSRRAGHRVGFTLVELLVVIAIVGLLVAILLPAVQAAREAARRTSCTSKLRNLALAVQNYHDAHQGYPRSRFRVPEDVGPNSRAWSWIARVLPFIEEQPLYDQLDLTRAKLGEKQHLIALPLDFLRCPSDSATSSPSRLATGHFEQFLMGVTNYKAVCGQNWGADETQDLDDIGSRWRFQGFHGSYDGQAHGDGIMWRDDYRLNMRDAKVLDGLSKTFLLGEDVPEYNLWNSWAYTNHVFGTCAIPPNVRDADPLWWPDGQGFRSGHPRGLQFALGDGSVKFIMNRSSEEDFRQYRRYAARQDPVELRGPP